MLVASAVSNVDQSQFGPVGQHRRLDGKRAPSRLRQQHDDQDSQERDEAPSQLHGFAAFVGRPCCGLTRNRITSGVSKVKVTVSYLAGLVIRTAISTLVSGPPSEWNIV